MLRNRPLPTLLAARPTDDVMAAPDPNDQLINLSVSRGQLQRAQQSEGFWGKLGGSSTGFWEGRPELTGSNLGVDWRDIRSTRVARQYTQWNRKRRVRRGESDPTEERMGNVLDQDQERGALGTGNGEEPDWSSPRRAGFSSDEDIADAEVVGEHDLGNVRSQPRESVEGYSYGGNYRGMDPSISGPRALPTQRSIGPGY
jgi:hypothetical protein